MRTNKLLTVLGVMLSLGSTNASAAPASGNYILNVAGILKAPINKFGSVKCSATAFLAPDTTGAPTVANLSAAILANSALTSSSAQATVSGQNFSCQIVVPFSFRNVLPGQKVIVAYTISVSDHVLVDPTVNPPAVLPTSGDRATRQTIPDLTPTSQTLPKVAPYL